MQKKSDEDMNESGMDGTKFIKRVCKKLGMQLSSTCTAQVFYHRFFARQNPKDHDRIDIATTCIFLASKVEEDVMKLEDVLDAVNSIRFNNKNEKISKNLDLLTRQQENIFMYERIVLNTLSFDLSVEHPHDFAKNFVKLLTQGGRQREEHDLFQVTSNILNDSISTKMVLKYHPRLIAAAVVSLAVHFIKSRTTATSEKPRFIQNYLNFEKQGTIFNYPINDIRVVEEELIKVYEEALRVAGN